MQPRYRKVPGLGALGGYDHTMRALTDTDLVQILAVAAYDAIELMLRPGMGIEHEPPAALAANINRAVRNGLERAGVAMAEDEVAAIVASIYSFDGSVESGEPSSPWQCNRCEEWNDANKVSCGCGVSER